MEGRAISNYPKGLCLCLTGGASSTSKLALVALAFASMSLFAFG